jgi:hypothetical protein
LSASGTLRLPQSYFWNGTTGSVKNGFGNIFIGRSDGTGSITVGNLTYTDPLTLQNYGSNSATISIIGTVSNAGNSTNSGHFKALAGGETYVSASTTITTYADILINSASYDGTVAATHGISLVGTTLNSNGGAIRLGGGTARDGSGYSTNGNIAYNGIRIATDPSTINSGGGDISIRAQSANNVAMALESGSAALSVNSGSGSITLDVLSGGAAGNPALYLANGGLSLTSTTGAINVTAKGSTTDSGAAVYQTGDGIYSAATYGLSLVSTSGPITLTASGAAGVGGLNLFGPLTLGGASTSGAITVAADRMALGNTAGSNIQTSGALTLKPYGISTSLGLGSGAGTLSLPQSYFWNGASGVVKAGLSSLTFGRTDGTGLLTLGGALTLNSSATTNLHAGSYIDSGSNILTVNAGSGTLNLAAHATAGNIGASGDSIDFAAGTTTVTTTGNGSAYITSAASYALGASTVGSGTLKVGAGGTATVTQSGAASAGTLVLDASGLTVTLSQAGNDFDTLNGTAGVLTLRDTDGLDVGALTATSFDLTTGGNVTSSGALSTGLLNLNLGSFDATLNYVGSNFTGGVRGTARHLTLRDDSGGISLGGSPLTLSGNLVVTSNGGAITQTGELVIGGTTTLTAGSYDITLTNASNDFTGAVNIVSARDTTLYDTNSLHLGNASVRKLTAIAGTGGGTPGAGDLYLDSGTVITASNDPNTTGLQSSVVLVSGKGSSGRFINNAGANAINLTGGNGTRWVVYTNNPYINGDVLGGLTSGSFAVFNTHYPDHNSTTRPSVARGPEHTDVLNGNRYVLSMDLADIPGADPSKVTVTALDVNKTYGDGLALSAGSATSVSFASGNTVISEFSEPAPAWLGVGNLTLTSAGTATTANVGSYGVSIGGDIGINPGSGLVYQTVTPTLSPSGTSTGIYSGACSYGTCQVTLKALGSVIVGQRVLTLTPDTTGVAANKTYDGTAAGTWTTAPTFTLGNTANSDVVTLTGTATATFADKNVGTSKTVTLSGFSASSANYALPMLPTYTADITARNITISATGQNKTYDATNVATVTLAPSASAAPGTAGSGFITGDLLTYSYTGAVFDTGKNAGSTLAITVSGLSLGGADAANYTLAAATASTSANIAQRAITLTALSGSKTYDGSAVLSAPTFALDASAILGSDALSGATGNATFNNRHAGNGKTLTADLATLTLTGADAGNYTLGTGSYVGSGNIIARTVTLTQGNVSRPYDGTAAYTLTAGDLSAFTTALGVSGDTVTAGSASFDSKHVGSGNKTLTLDSATVSDGNGGNNYALTLAGNNASTITQAALTVSTGNIIKTYDGTLTAAGSGVITVGSIFTGDSIDYSSLTTAFADKNAGSGNKTVTVGGSVSIDDGNTGGNYNVTLANNTTSTINTAALTVTAPTVTRNYDGTTTAAGVATASGLAAGDSVNAAATLNFDTKMAGTGKTVTASALTVKDGASANMTGNYSISYVADTASVIDRIALTLAPVSATKTYDGATNSAGAVTVTGLVSAYDTATVAQEYLLANALGANGSTLRIKSGYTILDGNSADMSGNYTITDTTTATGTINPRAVSLTGSRGYDGTTDVAAGIFTLGNRVTGETLTLSGSGTVLSKNVGAGKTVTLGSLALGNGSGGLASDYTLTGGTYAADITVASLTLSISNVSKTYSGNTTAVGTATVTGGTLFSGDTLSGGSFAFTNPNAGSGNKTVTVSGITISDGNGGANYTVGYASNTTSTITPLSITVAASAASKVYGNADPALDYSLTSGALVSGDSLSGALSRVTGENVGSYAIQQGTLANSNYAITYAGAQLAITARPITVTAAAQTKVYGAADPTLTYTLEANSSGRGLVVGDSFTGALARAAGTIVGNYAIGQGTLANGNYAITYTAADLVITAKTLTLAGSTGLSKTYDGSTAMPVGQNGYGSLVGIVGVDTVTPTGAPVFSSKDAGALAIQQGTLLLAGTDAGNYTLAWTNGSGTINPAPLSVRANDAANFVTQSVTGAAAFNGVSYSGFVAGETSAVVSGAAAITRTGTQTNAGTYSGVLTPAGLTAANYAISFVPGNYTIVPANQLLVEVQNLASTYGSAAAYSITSAKYLAGDGTTIANLTGGVSISGGNVTLNDGGSSASFSLGPSGGANSTGGFLKVGSYQLAAGAVTENSPNFSGTLTVVGAQSVTQKSLSAAATGGLSKVYDGTSAMNGLAVGLGGQMSGDVVSTAGNGAYAGKNAGSNLGYTVSALQLAGADAGNYFLTGGSNFAGGNGAITPKAIAASYTAADKVYDRTTTATVSGGSSGFIAGDTVSLTHASASFADRNVGAGKTVTVAGIGLAGSDAANYSVSAPTVLTTASITAKTLTLAGANGLARTYDGTVLMPSGQNGHGSLGGVVSGDTVSATGAPVYDGAAVGSHIIQQGTVGLAGADAGNYGLSWTDGTGAITQAVLTVRANNAANFVTQSVTGTQAFNGVSYSGFVNGETSTALGGAASISRIGNQTLAGTYSGVLVPSGLTAANYSFDYVAGNYTIVPASQLLVVVQNTSHGYGSAPTYAVTSAKYLASDGSTIADLSGSVNVTGTLVTITDGGATASFSLSPSGGTNSTAGYLKVGSYQLAAGAVTENSANFGSTLTLMGAETVDRKAITASYTASNKIYDGTTAATAAGSSAGVLTNDLVSFSSAAASFANRNVGTGKTVTIAGISLAGGDAANYTLSAYTATALANIAAANLTLSTSNVSKTYDRTTSAAGVAVVTAGTLYGGDSLTGGSFAFTDANAGSGNKMVTVSGVTVNDGNSGGNYNLTYASNTTSTISPKAITASFSANDKVYDGNATATATGSSSGVIGGDTVSFSYTAAAFADANVGVGKTVSISGIGLGGAQAGNYSLAATTASTAASITARPITVTADAKTKVYGTADPALTYQITVSSLIGSDTLANALSRVAGENVGSYAIQQGTLANGNYAITYVPAQFGITGKPLTLSGSTGLTKTYDGTTLMPLGSTGYGSLSGVTVGDSLTLTGAPAFAAANAGAQAIWQGTVLLIGANADNYSLSWTNGSGTISKAALTVRANDGANFITQAVTGTAAFNGVAASGFVNGETSAVLGGAATITRSGTQTAAGTYSGVLTPAGLTATNYDIGYVAGNYTLVPANQLLVTVGNAATNYATAATYAVTSAKYLASNNTTIVDLSGNVSAAGNAITLTDGANGAASFTLAPMSALYSTANLLRVGSYQLGASNVVETHANFSNTLTIVGSHTVSQKTVTAAASGIGKTYDGTTAMNGVSVDLNGRAANDAVTVSGLGAFASKNAGSNVGYSISNILLGGTDAGNYFLSGGTSLSGSNGTITPRSLTLVWTGQDKMYDGSTAATVSATDNRIGGDVFAVGAAANFADPMSGTSKPIAITGIGLSGTDAANYVLAAATGSASATIQALPTVPTQPTDPSTPGGPTGPGSPNPDPFNPFDPFDPTGGPTGPTDPSGTPTGPTDPSGTPTGPTDPSGTPTGPTDPSGTPTGPTDPSGTPTGPTDPSGTPTGPTDPSGTPTGPTDPSGTPTGPTDPSGTPTGPTDPSGTPTGPTDPSGTPTGPTGGPVDDSGTGGGSGTTITLGSDSDSRVVVNLPVGMTLANESGTVSVNVSSPQTAADAGDGGAVVSTTLSVTLLKNGVPTAGAAGVAITEADGALTVSPFDSPGSTALSLPGAVRNSIVLNLPASRGGDAASFDIDVTDSGIVVRSRNRLAQMMIGSHRDEVIALALAEVRRQLKTPLDHIKSIFIDQI